MAKVIDLPGAGLTWFSPTMAHSLMRGDLVSPDGGDVTWRVLAPAYEIWSETGAVEAEVIIGYDTDGLEIVLSFGWNEPVLRAIGARAGGLA